MQHHVYFWIKEEHKNAETLAAFEKGLEAVTKTPNIASGGWGKPAPTAVRPVTDNTFDYGLYLSFDSLEKHDAYQVHLSMMCLSILLSIFGKRCAFLM
jgi:hypothetical protein